MSLQPGNSKLGPLIAAWSLLAVATCPGRSKLCEKLCYAEHGHFLFPTVRNNHTRNWKEIAESEDFISWMCTEIRRMMLSIVRVHVAGDFYSPEYVLKWLEIARRNPKVIFYVYTRSWREPEILEVLKLLIREKNFIVWFSCDRETGAPPRVSRRVRRAFMAENDADVPRFKVNMVFRNTVKTLQKFDPSGALVCLYENGVSYKEPMSCSKCKLCFVQREVPRKKDNTCPSSTNQSKALQVIE